MYRDALVDVIGEVCFPRRELFELDNCSVQFRSLRLTVRLSQVLVPSKDDGSNCDNDSCKTENEVDHVPNSENYFELVS